MEAAGFGGELARQALEGALGARRWAVVVKAAERGWEAEADAFLYEALTLESDIDMYELFTEGAYGLQDEDCGIIQSERDQAMAFFAAVRAKEGNMLGDLRAAVEGPVAPLDGGLCDPKTQL